MNVDTFKVKINCLILNVLCMKSLLKIFSLSLILFASACVDSDPDPTQLEITVLNYSGAVVNEAKVSLYTTESDLINGTNPVSVQYTNSAGKVLFSNLFPVRYFWYIEKGCNDNSHSSYGSASAIAENVTSTINVIIYPKTNSLYVSSYVSGDFYCYVNGTYYGIIDGFDGLMIDDLSDGVYFVELLEVNYILFQTTYSSTVELSCGAYFILNYGLDKSGKMEVKPNADSPFEYLKEEHKSSQVE